MSTRQLFIALVSFSMFWFAYNLYVSTGSSEVKWDTYKTLSKCHLYYFFRGRRWLINFKNLWANSPVRAITIIIKYNSDQSKRLTSPPHTTFIGEEQRSSGFNDNNNRSECWIVFACKSLNPKRKMQQSKSVYSTSHSPWYKNWYRNFKIAFVKHWPLSDN